LLIQAGDRLEYAIEVNNVKKQFLKEKGYVQTLFHPFRKNIIPALDGVSLKVKKGEVCGLLGPNGAGKTTLMKILATLIIADSGSVFVNKFDVIKNEQKVKDSIGLIHNDERSFFWRLTGRQNLEFFASLYALKGRALKLRVDEVLRIVGLEAKSDIRFDSYSTGMRRRLGFARGLLINPDVLLVDEPTSGVDPVTTIRLRTFLKEEIAKRLGKTVLLATHDLKEAQSICDRIIILHKGKIRADGTLDRLQKIVGAEYIDLEFKAEEDIIKKINKLKTVQAVCKNGNNCRIKVTSTHKALPKIINIINQGKGIIYDCKTCKTGLDKIFEKYVGD
jgi:ABC-2 type transport system ATP-binding protein